MERLWTPWRMRYVAGDKRAGCVFCDALAASDDAESLILWRGERAFVILNLYPYNTGHAMIVPNAHAAQLDALDPETRSEMFELALLYVEAARGVLRCAGFNLGLNLGDVAGAGVAEHLHMHAVPRWLGDANFMPILAGTMVMPELLPVTYARLRAEIERLQAERSRGEVAQAGALVVLPERGSVALRLAAGGGIVIPKGHVEPGEAAGDAALREVLEETGIEAAIEGWAGSYSFVPDGAPPGAAPRHVVFVVARGRGTPSLDEHLGADTVLVPVDDVVDQLTHPASQAVARAALPALRRLAGGQHAR